MIPRRNFHERLRLSALVLLRVTLARQEVRQDLTSFSGYISKCKHRAYGTLLVCYGGWLRQPAKPRHRSAGRVSNAAWLKLISNTDVIIMSCCLL